ncbi:MAG: electron transfer flavoprotein subunit alpha/FixB family protein, partial [Nocardioides sp.]
MSEVLVLIDHVDGAVRKPTYELLAIAKRLGEPSAVFIGGADQASGAVDAVK